MGGKQSVYTVLLVAVAKLIASCVSDSVSILCGIVNISCQLSMSVCDYLATDAEVSIAKLEKKRECWYDSVVIFSFNFGCTD